MVAQPGAILGQLRHEFWSCTLRAAGHRAQTLEVVGAGLLANGGNEPVEPVEADLLGGVRRLFGR